MAFRRLALAVLAACAAATLSGCAADEQRIEPEIRNAGLRFSTAVPEGDQQWILAAIAKARPEAQQLINDVDGMVVITLFNDRNTNVFGLTKGTAPGAYEVSFNIAWLNTDRKIDRDATVLHELGHVIDHRLVPPALRNELAAALPASGACATPEMGDCTAAEERFADTFAKWALRGAVSAAGVGYGVIAPASLEDWGAPLSTLAIEIDVASR